MKIIGKTVCCLSILFLLSVLLKQTVFCEMYYTSEVLIGEKAAGMGGAFSAVADSAEAGFYNPAGLVLAEVPYLSISSQVADFNQQVAKFLFKDGEKFYSQELVPSFTGISKKIGNGRLGFTIVIPYYSAYELHETYEDISLNISGTTISGVSLVLDKKSVDKTYLIGPSYSARINSKLLVGTTLYMHYNVLSSQNNIYFDIVNSSLNMHQKTIDESSGTGYGFSGIFGLLFKATPKLNTSLVIKSGDRSKNNINYKGVADRYRSDDLTPHQSSPHLNKVIENNFRMPPSTTVGVAYKINPKILLSYDLSYFIPIAYNVEYFYVPTVGDNAYQYVKKERRERKESIFNHSIGGQYMISENVPLRFGFYTNYSLAPKIDSERIAYLNTALQSNDKHVPPTPSHIDKYGITISSGLISENSTLMFNIKYGFGSGEMVGQNIELNEIEKRDVKFTNYGFGFSGSYWF